MTVDTLAQPSAARALSESELHCSIIQAEASQRYFDAAESGQWTLERDARNANDRWLKELHAERMRRSKGGAL